jgi:nickel-dependent lactate racemase
MEIQIPYGHSYLTAHLPDEIGVDIIEATPASASPDPDGEVRAALDNLLGEVNWSDFFGAKSVAIAVNDKTRPVPHQYLLPPLLERLASLGIPSKAITFYVAVGTHPPILATEFPLILPTDILESYTAVSHDSEDVDQLVCLGETSRGTPIWVNRDYVQAEFKIVIGNIEPHQFVGFSGGVKSAAIGLAGLETINRSHAMMTHPDSRLGEYEANPARQDVEEIGQKVGVHLALNAILNQEKQIVSALAGDPVAVMREGIPRSRQVCQVEMPQKYGLAIVSPGGHPKDINLYQSQKGLAHAALITQLGGTLILVAACPEGTGSSHYEDWALGKRSHAEVIKKFKTEGFRIGPHKAFQIARDATRLRLMFYSEMDQDLSRALLLNPVKDLQTAIDAALADLQPEDRIGILPHASSTIPYIESTRGAL